jgi:hypothetical protein
LRLGGKSGPSSNLYTIAYGKREALSLEKGGAFFVFRERNAPCARKAKQKKKQGPERPVLRRNTPYHLRGISHAVRAAHIPASALSAGVRTAPA